MIGTLSFSYKINAFVFLFFFQTETLALTMWCFGYKSAIFISFDAENVPAAIVGHRESKQ